MEQGQLSTSNKAGIATMNLFGDHLVEEDRSPTNFLSIGGYQLGLLAPKPAFFLQVIIVRIVCNESVLYDHVSCVSHLLDL
jgi:hypothetical protein